MLTKLNSVAVIGLNPQLVEVEVDVSQGKPEFFIIAKSALPVRFSAIFVKLNRTESPTVSDPASTIKLRITPVRTAIYDVL